MIFIGPTLPGGIAQWAYNYTRLFPGSKYYTLIDEVPECDHAFVFALPVDVFFNRYDYVKSRVKNITIVTICETESVHEDFALIFKDIKRVVVPSEFCKQAFLKQFPDIEFHVVPAYVPPPRPYVFYTIGNMTDRRKNFEKLLQTFVKLNDPNTMLVVKQQSNCPITVDVPNVQIINEQLDDHQMDLLHRQCDCYINFSHSEGIGMGPVEAALRDKPVIIPEFGATREYVKTPYTIPCEKVPVGKVDYLFKEDMIWGEPDTDKLLEFMRDVSSRQLKYMDHTYTKNLVSSENVLKQLHELN